MTNRIAVRYSSNRTIIPFERTAMSQSSDTSAVAARPHTKWGFSVLFGVIGSLIVGLVVLAFVWPIATASAKDLPIAITGPSAQVSAVVKAVNANGAGVIAFQTVSDRDAALSRI